MFGRADEWLELMHELLNVLMEIRDELRKISDAAQPRPRVYR